MSVGLTSILVNRLNESTFLEVTSKLAAGALMISGAAMTVKVAFQWLAWKEDRRECRQLLDQRYQKIQASIVILAMLATVAAILNPLAIGIIAATPAICGGTFAAALTNEIVYNNTYARAGGGFWS